MTARPAILPPPADLFIPAGPILAVQLGVPKHEARRRYTGTRALGIGYEKKVQQELFRRWPEAYCQSPWLKYFADGKWRFCQPDGLLIRADASLVIFEIKYSHTQRAWWQLRRLYQPVLQKMFPGWGVEICEVVKWYEPDPFYPEFVRLAEDPLQPSSDFKVHIYRP